MIYGFRYLHHQGKRIGYDQIEGVDYTEIFSPIIKPTIILVVLTLALSKG